MKIPFVGGTARDRSIQVDNQETVNFIASVKGAGAKAPVVLESAPGLIDQGAIGDGACRTSKLVNWKGDLYGVFGTKLCQIASTGLVSAIGTLNDNAGRVTMARGRDYLALVDGTDGYTYNGTTFAAIADTDFPAIPTHIVYLDGFFIVNDAGTDDFYLSATEDPTSWDALDFAAASTAPDKALAIAASESLLYVIGDETCELYYNSGNADFPYTRIISATQEVGIAAPDTLAESDDGLFWLATTPEGGRFVFRLRGQSGEVITGDAQEYQLGRIADLSTCWAFIYRQSGNAFYVLQLDGGTNTLVYNLKAELWETREGPSGAGWRAGGHGVLAGDNIVGSRLTNRHYRLDLSTYMDAGEDMVRRRRTQIYHSAGSALDWHELIVEIPGGVGNAAAPGDNPTIRLRYSDDGGNTWSNSLTAPVGKQGEYTRRAMFRNLGSSPNRIFEVESSDPVPIALVGAYAVVTLLDG